MAAVAVDLDRVLGDTRPLWDAWLADAARRFRSIAELEPDELPRDRGEAAAELDRWAERGIGDWRSALKRFAEDRAPIYLRPDPRVNAALRELARGATRIGVFTDAPEPLARIALSQLGAARHVEVVEAGAGALARVRERLGSDVRVIATRESLYAPDCTPKPD